MHTVYKQHTLCACVTSLFTACAITTKAVSNQDQGLIRGTTSTQRTYISTYIHTYIHLVICLLTAIWTSHIDMDTTTQTQHYVDTDTQVYRHVYTQPQIVSQRDSDTIRQPQASMPRATVNQQQFHPLLQTYIMHLYVHMHTLARMHHHPPPLEHALIHLTHSLTLVTPTFCSSESLTIFMSPTEASCW